MHTYLFNRYLYVLYISINNMRKDVDFSWKYLYEFYGGLNDNKCKLMLYKWSQYDISSIIIES